MERPKECYGDLDAEEAGEEYAGVVFSDTHGGSG